MSSERLAICSRWTQSSPRTGGALYAWPQVTTERRGTQQVVRLLRGPKETIRFDRTQCRLASPRCDSPSRG
jgi:hypothetical protein